jgi:hypothetical protein
LRKKIYVCRETILQLKNTGSSELLPIIVETNDFRTKCLELTIIGTSKLITDLTSDPTVYIQTDSTIIADGNVIE